MEKKLKNIILTAIILAIAFYCLFIVLKIFTADSLFAQGSSEINQGKWQTGIAKLKKSARFNPEEPSYWKYLGRIYAKLSSFGIEEKAFSKKASAFLTKAVSLNSRNSLTLKSAFWGFMDLADIDQSYLSQAQNTAEKLVELSPSDPTGFYYLGLVFEKNGNYGAAKKFLEKAISLKKNYKEALEKFYTLESQTGP